MECLSPWMSRTISTVSKTTTRKKSIPVLSTLIKWDYCKIDLDSVLYAKGKLEHRKSTETHEMKYVAFLAKVTCCLSYLEKCDKNVKIKGFTLCTWCE